MNDSTKICLYCGKEINSENTLEIKNLWHTKCAVKFFGTKDFPEISVSKEQLENLATETVSKGFTVAGGNCSVAESGLYTLQVDYENNKVIVEPAVVIGMDAPFGNGGWDKTLEAAKFTINGKLASKTAVAAGNIRTFVSCTLNGDWWHAEFVPKDGKIVYREAGGDPEAIAIAAGQTLTYDFNAGTGVIK